MHCVQSDGKVEAHAGFAGIPLSVVFAEAAAIDAVRTGAARALALVPPFHVSDEDAYLVLPDDIGMEILDILKDGDLDLIGEAMRDGLLVVGEIARAGKGAVQLHVERVVVPAEALSRGMPYAETADAADVAAINALDHLQVTMGSALLDEDGLDEMLRAREWAGTSWRAPSDAPAHLRGAEPTYAWSRRLGPDRVGIEMALFVEYEEMVVLLRPVLVRG